MFDLIDNTELIHFRKLDLYKEGLGSNLVYMYILGRQNKKTVYYDNNSFYSKPEDFYFLVELLEKSVELN